MNKERVKVIVKLGDANLGIMYINNNITDGYDPEDVVERLNDFAIDSDYNFELYQQKPNNILGLTPKNKQKSKQPEEV